MNLAHVEAIVKAVLYEGYILYPYRPSNVKNRQRWTFGGIYPREYADRDKSCTSRMQTECLLRGGPDAALTVQVRFLHLVRREIGELTEPVAELPAGRIPAFAKVASLRIGDEIFHAWEEAVERQVAVPELRLGRLAGSSSVQIPIAFAAESSIAPLRGEAGRVCGLLMRSCEDVRGVITIAASEIAPGVFRVRVQIDNRTPLPPSALEPLAEAQRRMLASTHTVLGVRAGAFISLLDPPDELKDAAAACSNQGTWPVLVGVEGATDTLLSSPIILYDYPRVAPESPGDLFDATEIDEILTLRILAMTDEEKREMASLDERTRALLQRTQSLTATDMARLHGTRRDAHLGGASPDTPSFDGQRPQTFKPELAFLHIGGRDLTVGDRVRLCPNAGGDIMDLVLKDEVAVIEAIERDFDDKVHVAVVVEADPGREFGLERMPGHRFFFSPDEIRPVEKEGPA
jgi:hydrogenase maturation protease